MITKVEDIMTERVVAIPPDMSLPEAAMILNRGGFNGLPVVDVNNKLIGLFTERNMVSDKSYLQMETLLKIFSKLEFYKKDNSPIQDDLKNLINTKIKDVMTSSPQTVKVGDSIESVVALFSNPANNPLPVVDDSNRLLGIIALSDLTRLYGVATKKSLLSNSMDKQVDQFMDKFEKQFVVVTKFRVSTWFLVSLMFAFVGFAVAMFLIVRISFE